MTQKFIKAVRDLVEASEAALDFMDQDRADTYYNPLPDEVEHFREAILIALIELEEQENDRAENVRADARRVHDERPVQEGRSEKSRPNMEQQAQKEPRRPTQR